MKTIFRKIKNIPPSRAVIVLLFFGMYFKNLLLQFYIAGGNHFVPDLIDGIPSVLKGLFLSLVTVVLFTSVLLLFKKQKGKVIYLTVVSLLFTTCSLIDCCYYRTSPEMPSLVLLALSGDSMEAGHLNLRSVFDTFSVYDILFFLDYVLIGLFFLVRRFYRKNGEEPAEDLSRKVNGKTRLKYFATVALPCVGILLVLPICNLFGLFQSSYRAIYAPAFPKDTALYFTPIGYHVVDAVSVFKDMILEDESEYPPYDGTNGDFSQIEKFYEYNEEILPNNAFFAQYQGKNLLFIQVESLENFVIGQKIDGVEITPNLNKLVAEDASSIYFPNIYEQVKSGNSSDCDLIINTSILPTSRLFFRTYGDKYLPSMPELLRKHGYRTFYFNGSGSGSVWSYDEVYKNTFGYDVDPDSPDCNFMMLDPESEEDIIYRYLSDEKTFQSVTDTLTKSLNEGERYFAHVVLCSSHMPFLYAPEEDRIFSAMYPEEKNSKVLGYLDSIHYADRQIGIFLENAEAAGVLENTIVVLYGDHTGLHKYYPQEADAIADRYDELAFLNEDKYSTLPLIVYDPSGTTAHVCCETIGGQIDILPTVMYLVGMEREEYSFAMGKNILNTDRNYTVLSNGTIVGDFDEESEEYEILYRMYNTADLIVKENYFKKDE